MSSFSNIVKGKIDIATDIESNTNKKKMVIDKTEWQRLRNEATNQKSENPDFVKENFMEALFGAEQLFIKDLQTLVDQAKEFSCKKGSSFWDIKILDLGNDKIISKNEYEISGYSYTPKDGKKRFFSTDVFVYGLHPKKFPQWTSRHFNPWIESNKIPAFWQVKCDLENDVNFPCWLIDNSNPEKSKWSYFRIFFDNLTTKIITINNKKITVFGNNLYWHGGNSIGSTFNDLVSI